MIYKCEFAIHGTASDELCGLDLDLSVGLGDGMRVHTAHGYKAAEVGALLIGLGLTLCSELTGGPSAHIAGTVHRAVTL